MYVYEYFEPGWIVNARKRKELYTRIYGDIEEPWKWIGLRFEHGGNKNNGEKYIYLQTTWRTNYNF